MIYFDLKSDSEYLTVCPGTKRNIAFTNLCILFLDFQKNYMRCLSYNICLTKNCSCRYEVFHGHRRNAHRHAPRQQTSRPQHVPE